MNSICLLSVRPCIKTYQFFKLIKLNTPYDVFIVIDDNNYDIPDYDGIVPIIKINNTECENAGFKSTVMYFDNRACSRDKALYYFTRGSINYQHIWFIEEDVFIPTIHTIEQIDKKYEGDLLVRNHYITNEKKTDWHWNKINRQIKLDPPYACSMICAIRCSKALLQGIKEYAETHHNLFMDEALFNTIALKHDLQVTCIPELVGIEYERNWNRSEIVDTHLYHPIKNIDTQYCYRLNTQYYYRPNSITVILG